MPEAMLTVKQAAETLGLSYQTIYRYIDRGVFNGVIERGMLKRQKFIPASEVERVRVEGNFGERTGNKVAHYATA